MNQKKIYITIILGLVGLNIVVLAFFLLTRPRPQHHPPPKKFQSEVVKILRLNKQQATTFNALADEHRLQINAINERKAKLLLPYFERLADTSKRIDADSLLNQFQQAEKEKIEATYQHFQEIKKILNIILTLFNKKSQEIRAWYTPLNYLGRGKGKLGSQFL